MMCEPKKRFFKVWIKDLSHNKVRKYNWSFWIKYQGLAIMEEYNYKNGLFKSYITLTNTVDRHDSYSGTINKNCIQKLTTSNNILELIRDGCLDVIEELKI